MLWYDEPAYYSEPSFVTVDLKVPEVGGGAQNAACNWPEGGWGDLGAGHAVLRPHELMQVPLVGGDSSWGGRTGRPWEADGEPGACPQQIACLVQGLPGVGARVRGGGGGGGGGGEGSAAQAARLARKRSWPCVPTAPFCQLAAPSAEGVLTPLPLPLAPCQSLQEGGRCRPQRPWGSSSVPPYQQDLVPAGSLQAPPGFNELRENEPMISFHLSSIQAQLYQAYVGMALAAAAQRAFISPKASGVLVCIPHIFYE